MAPFPDDVEDVHDFRFYQGTDDDRFRYAGIRFLRRAQAARQEGDAQVGDDGLDHEVPLARFEDDLWLETDFLTVLADFVVQTQRILHIRGDKHHRTGVTFGDFCHQRRAGGTGQFAKLALVARFTR